MQGIECPVQPSVAPYPCNSQPSQIFHRYAHIADIPAVIQALICALSAAYLTSADCSVRKCLAPVSPTTFGVGYHKCCKFLITPAHAAPPAALPPLSHPRYSHCEEIYSTVYYIH